MPADCRIAAQPIARRALRGRDLDVGHLIGDFAPQPYRVAIALHRREIKPLMCGDEIDRRVAADRIHHSEFEQHVACGRALAQRRGSAVENFITSHSELPCPSLPMYKSSGVQVLRCASLAVCKSSGLFSVFCPVRLRGPLPQSIRDNPQKI